MWTFLVSIEDIVLEKLQPIIKATESLLEVQLSEEGLYLLRVRKVDQPDWAEVKFRTMNNICLIKRIYAEINIYVNSNNIDMQIMRLMPFKRKSSGSVKSPFIKPTQLVDRNCSVPGCKNKVADGLRFLCRVHYNSSDDNF